MSSKLIPTILSILILTIAGFLTELSSQEQELDLANSDTPAWLLRSLGRQARLERRLDDSFYLLHRSLDKEPQNPETMIELANSHFASGDFHQSELYYQGALENAALLPSSDLQYQILYSLADIYFFTENYLSYEKSLRDIVESDVDFTSNELADIRQRRNIRSLLNGNTSSSLAGSNNQSVSNLDQVIRLYRIDDSFSLPAYISLGQFYVHSGRYEEAQEHLLFAVVKIYSNIIDRLRKRDYQYAFTDSKDMFDRASTIPQYFDYLRSSLLDEALYYLGAASFGFNPNNESVYKQIWQTLDLLPYTSRYTIRASEQVESPSRENILYGSEDFRNSVNGVN